MNDRFERKKRRSQDWRRRAERVCYNELHQEWSRRNRYYTNTSHRNPRLRVDSPTYPPRPDDGWWQRAMAQCDPARRSFPRNSLMQCGTGVLHQFYTLDELFDTLASL